MPIKRHWEIKPGGGKKANEFDELDVEDQDIAAAEEKKAQAGIPPGSDHPLVVSHKNEAIKASKQKASLDLVFGENREIAIAKMKADEDMFSGDKEIKLTEEKWPGMEIDIDEEEIAWFMDNFRQKPSAKDVDTPVEKLGVFYDPRVVKKELQAIYHAKHELIGKPELERRDLIIEHYEEYAAAMASTKGRPPRHFVKTEKLPLVRKLTDKEMKAVYERRRMDLITSKHPNFSPPFRAMRDYLIFLAVFLAFIYCGFTTDKLEVRTKLTAQLSTDDVGFPSVTTVTQLETWIDDYFMDLFYPETGPNGDALTCQNKQYLSDGVNLKLGNVRVRQIRSGKSSVKEPWEQSKIDKYATCVVPEIFQPAIGERCFRSWGGQTFPEEMSNLYRGLKWHSEAENDVPETYSVPSRLQWPGSGYTKLIANERSLAQEDFDAYFDHTMIDIQTRAVFIEANLLNVPTNMITAVKLLVQLGAEGEILSTVDADVTNIYKYMRIVEIAYDRFFSDNQTYTVGVIFLILTFLFVAYICLRIFILPFILSFLISAGIGLCMMWWTMSIAYASKQSVDVSPYLVPGLEFLVYSCVFFQAIIEYRIIQRGRKSGDTLVALCFKDMYNALHILNLAFWLACFGMRCASLRSLASRMDQFEDAIVDPCYKTVVASDYANGIGNYSFGEANAWANTPDGCFGVYDASTHDVDYGNCPSDTSARAASKCCAEVGFVSMFWPVELDIWVQQLMAFNAFLLCVRFFKFVSMFNSLALFANTLKEAVLRVAHLAVIIMLIMTAFSVSFHLAFGFSDQSYRDFPEALKTLFEIILGSFDLSSLRVINPYLAPVFFYLYVLVIVMILLSMFVAVVNNSYEGVLEKMTEPSYCFMRDILWLYCVDEAEKEPINSQHELFHRMNLTKSFIKNPGTETLSESDRKQLKQCIDTLKKYAFGKGVKPGQPLPLYFPFRRPDGKTVDGAPTDILIKNTELFRAALNEKCGADNEMMVNDIVHLYWSFLQIPPLCWIIKMQSLPGKVARYIFPTVENFKKKFEETEPEEEEEQDQSSGASGRDQDDDEEKSQELTLVKKKHLRNENDLFLIKSGLTSAQVDMLHQFEEPKLSILQGMSKVEEGQRRVLFAMDMLARTAKDYKEQVRKMEEAKEEAAASDAKKQAMEQAELQAKAYRENSNTTAP